MTVQNQLLEQAVIESIKNPAYFCRFFLSHWFPEQMPPFHLGILALVTRQAAWLKDYEYAHEFLLNEFYYLVNPSDPDSPKIPIFQQRPDGTFFMVAGQNNEFVVPRGFSKTTLLNAANLRSLVIDPKTFSVYVSESATHAEQQLGNIKLELESNELLRAAYGNLVPKRSDSERWSSDQIQLLNGALLVARGRGAQIRGINFRGRRPNRILLDDVEDEESILTDNLRLKTVNWFYGSVAPAGNEMSGAKDNEDHDELQITVLGTLLGVECLINTIAEDPTFNTVRFGAKLDDGTMLWDYKMSRADYEKKRQRYAQVGKLSVFAREFDSTIRADEDAKFAAHNVRIREPISRDALVQVAMALDPAISDQPGRDHTALIVAGRTEKGMIYILDEWGGLGITPSEKIEKLFYYYSLWGPMKVGIEAQQYQKALIHLVKEEMARRQKFFVVEPLFQGPDKTKDDRIVGILAPRYANGYIRHRRPLPALETQLMDFPNGKKDYADAAAMALSLLGETAMLVAPEDSAVFNDEYAPLHTELPPLYDERGGFYIYEKSPHQRFIEGRYG